MLEACRGAGSWSAGPDLDFRGLRHRADVPIDERHPLQGQSPYSATKIAADALGGATIAPSVCRSPSCGPSMPSARASRPADYSHDHQPGPDPTEHPLGRLDPRRDLTYVKDTVSGFVAIAGCDAALGRPST